MGKCRLQLEAFKFPSFEADSNNSALKDCPQNTENLVIAPWLHESIPSNEGNIHLLWYFKMIRASLRWLKSFSLQPWTLGPTWPAELHGNELSVVAYAA